MYIKGTNIEVGIRRVSSDPDNPFAQCVFRYGHKIWKKGKSRINPRKHIVQKIPFKCLTHSCDIDLRRHKLKETFTYSKLQHKMPKAEGLFDEEKDPDIYHIYPCGTKYLHIMKGPTPEHIFKRGCTPQQLSIFGIEELTFPFHSFEPNTKMCIFNTKPKRVAHISVVRSNNTMAFLGRHTNRWPHARVSTAFDTRPTEIGYIRGTSVPVSCIIEKADISYYKITGTEACMWLPNEEVCCLCPNFECSEDVDELIPVEGKIGYINGLPYPFQIYALPSNDVHKGKPSSSPYLFAMFKGGTNSFRAVKAEHIQDSIKPSYKYLENYRPNDAFSWKLDHANRLKKLNTKPIAVA
jgi:hypothetical protein